MKYNIISLHRCVFCSMRNLDIVWYMCTPEFHNVSAWSHNLISRSMYDISHINFVHDPTS